MRRAWKTAVFGTILGAALSGGFAFANPPNAKFIQYEFHQNDDITAFSIAWEAMSDIYNGTRYEKNQTPPDNPLIGIGQFDLNGDKIPEIIAYPTEEDVEAGWFCEKNDYGICPNYILEIRGEKVHRLGKIFASSIDRGDTITNGYWELKAYSHDWTTPVTDEYDLYVYDKKADGYVKAPPPDKQP